MKVQNLPEQGQQLSKEEYQGCLGGIGLNVHILSLTFIKLKN
jgi:hypothetical protein